MLNFKTGTSIGKNENTEAHSWITISLLSMPTLRRLAATELMSLSLIQDLNSLTAKAADTPVQTEQFRFLLYSCKCSSYTQCYAKEMIE